jgi:hypothetical protein
MLAANTSTKGSARFAAIERASGSLNGRKGTFVLQHYGVMARAAPELTITVVPDSGTDELVGLSGKTKINIVDGKNVYEFDYTQVAGH